MSEDMDKKLVELLMNEQAKHEGSYHDAGVWLGLNWVLEEAPREAGRMGIYETTRIKKRYVIEAYEEAKRKRGDRSDTCLSLYTGEIEGLEKAIEIMKKF